MCLSFCEGLLELSKDGPSALQTWSNLASTEQLGEFRYSQGVSRCEHPASAAYAVCANWDSSWLGLDAHSFTQLPMISYGNHWVVQSQKDAGVHWQLERCGSP